MLSLKGFNRITIRSKVTIWLLSVTILSVLVIAVLGWQAGESALHRAISNQLTSQRNTKAYQIEKYFDIIEGQVQTLSEDRMIVDAMKELKAAYVEFPGESIPQEWEAEIDRYYESVFFPSLMKYTGTRPQLSFYRPGTRAGQYLQYHYIAGNPFPVKEKDLLIDPQDGSSYSAVHAKYHPILRNFVKEFRYYDLFLIDFGRGDIVYSVFKETDFATSLIDGPYRDSNLAELIQAVKRDPDVAAAKVVDFEPYTASYGAPAAFVASPIFDGARAVGVLAMQLPIDEINAIMTGNQGWERDGLGKTGQTYLAGSDYLMRSTSRLLIEDRERYLRTLSAGEQPEGARRMIERFGTPILLQSVKTEGSRAALAGRSDTSILDDYRGIPVLCAYAPLEIEGLNWAILAEMTKAEAFAPIARLQRSILIATVVLILLVVWLAIVLSNLLTRPIHQLTEAVRRAEAGDYDFEVTVDSEDELTELAHTFNLLVQNLRRQTDAIERSEEECERLLSNVLPPHIAERRKRGEAPIADHLKKLTILFLRVDGLAALGERLSAEEVTEILSRLCDAIEATAKRYNVERIKSLGGTHLLVCGLSEPRLDHSKQAVDCGVELLGLGQRFHLEDEIELGFRLGVGSGEVSAGVVGETKFGYELWGETVEDAYALSQAARPGTILVTRGVYGHLRSLYELESGETVEAADRRQVESWRLVSAEPR